MSVRAQPDPEDVCAGCHRLYDQGTRQIVEAWKAAKWVTAGPGKCAGCQGVKDQIQQDQSIPMEGGGS